MRRDLKAQLLEGEARLQAVLDTAVDGIITIDERGIIESVNHAVQRIFGYSQEELLGRNINCLMPPPYHDRHDGYLEAYLNTGTAKIIGIGRVVEGLRKDGKTFPLELAVSEVQLPDRRLFTGIVRDVTERRRAEEESTARLKDLAHTARLLELGEMTTGIAHEVNQPLAAIVSFAEACLRMLASGTGDDDTIRGALEQIAEQGHRAGSIIHGLRQLARKADVCAEWLDLNDVVRDVVTLIAHEIRHGEVELVLELSDDLPKIKGYKVQIEQVVLNLARNAIEAMADVDPGKRILSIGTSMHGADRVMVIQVLDTGTGIDAAEFDQVFETFYSTKPGGVGIGLSISRTILEAHGGKLWVERTADDRTQFCFTLPITENDD